MSEGYAALDAHAYVDSCLNADDRAAFEGALRRDTKLKARVDAWESQNEAIRLAFGAAPKARLAPTLARPSNENNVSAKPRVDRRRLPEAEPARRPAPVFSWQSKLATGVCVFLFGMAGFSGGPSDPRDALIDRATATLRSAQAFADTKLDFVSDDPRAVAGWLKARFARLNWRRLSPPGWTLLGVRVTPGVTSAAAMVLYEDALGGRAGLLIEPTDASPDYPPLGGREGDETIFAGVENGFAYAAVGPTRSGVGALAPSDGD